METKHTPGPWKILWYNYNYFATINKDTSTRICAIKIDDKGHAPLDEAHANAKLIAAAPELLEALTILMETMRPHIMKMGIRKGFSEHAAFAQAQTAIHKATE